MDDRRRNRRSQYGGEDDAWGMSDAEDRYDDGSPFNLDIGDYIGGLLPDEQFGRSDAPRQPRPPRPRTLQTPPSAPPQRGGDSWDRVQRLRQRFASRQMPRQTPTPTRRGFEFDLLDMVRDYVFTGSLTPTNVLLAAITALVVVMLCIALVLLGLQGLF